jgi:hypothetical protein
VTTTIPEDLRKLARAEVQRRQAHRAAQSATTAAASSPPTPTPAPLPYALEELYAMAIEAKLEITLKFSALPNAKSAGQGKMAFALKTPDGPFVTAEVGNKVWNKLVKAAQGWPTWIAALSGTMGERTEKGFALAGPGLQVFEKKVKAAEATAPADTPAPPPPLAPVMPPPPATPVIVTTGAGTATVTKRAPLSLKRNASTEGTPG